MKNILLVLLLFATSIFSQWELQYSNPNYSFASVYFASIDTGYAIGYPNKILKTTDKGKTWFLLENPTGINLKSIFFVDSKNGWASGYNGIILKTANSGENWQAIPTGVGNHLWSVYFINKNVGWTVCSAYILKTTDGGYNWEVYNSNQPSLYSVYFINEQLGWACGDWGAILRTLDGGKTWLPQNINRNYSFYSIYFIDQFIGYAAGTDGGQEIIYKTTDGGVTWNLNYRYSMNLRLNSICFRDINNGWAIGNNNRILHTTDGGSLWMPIQSLTENDMYQSMHFIDKNNGWIVGSNGNVQKTYLQLNLPLNGAKNQSPKGITFNWVQALDVQKYILQVSTDSLFSTLAVNDSTITQPSKTISGLINGTKYYWKVIAKCNSGNNFESKVRSFTTQNSILGKFVYDNLNNSIIANTPIVLSNGSINIDTSITDNQANYSLSVPMDGTYIITPKITKPWDGVNAADALGVAKYFVGTYSLTGLKLKAADVNNSGSVNTSDALEILRRYVGITNSFPAGDWFTESPTITVNGANVVRDIKAICIGDVNASYSSLIAKTEGNIELIRDGRLSVKNQNHFICPIKMNKPVTLGAISLEIKFNNREYKIQSIESELPNFHYSINSDRIKIGMFSPDGCTVKNDNTVLRLNVSKISTEQNGFQLELISPSEINDIFGDRIQGVKLLVPSIENSVPMEYSLEQNYPNPFNPETTIKFALPLISEVTLTLFNTLGEKVQTVVSGVKEGGVHEVKIRSNNLPSGIYYYRLAAKSVETGTEFISTKKLIILK